MKLENGEMRTECLPTESWETGRQIYKFTDRAPFNRVSHVIRGYPGLVLLLLCDRSRKLAPLFQPIRCNTETNHDSFSRVFPRFRRYACFILSSYWLVKVLSSPLIDRCQVWFWFYNNQSKTALCRPVNDFSLCSNPHRELCLCFFLVVPRSWHKE